MCVCVCVRGLVYSTCIVRNELIRVYASVVHTSGSFRPHTRTHARTHARTHTHTHTHTRTHARTHAHTHTHTHTHTDTHMLIPFEDREPTRLKVGIADVCEYLVWGGGLGGGGGGEERVAWGGGGERGLASHGRLVVVPSSCALSKLRLHPSM